jgi:hypothetical protein
MATSASTDYNLTAQQIINYALRKINVLSQHEAPSAEDADRALTEMNLMLKGWQRYEQLWRLTEGYVLLVANTAGYSMTPRPFRVYSVRYRNSSSEDTIMTRMSREHYFQLPDRTLNGIPTQWWFDPQRDTDSLYVWPVLETIDGTTPERLQVTYQRRYEDVDTLTENVDVPQQYLDVVGHNLAARLADSYGRGGAHVDRIIARAENLKHEMLDDDRADFVQIVPETRYYG